MNMKSGKQRSFDVVTDCKRRNSSRMNQIRHRAKQKDRLEHLTTSIHELKLNVQRFECSTFDCLRLVQYVKVQTAQIRLHIIQHFYQLFQCGVQNTSEQFAFFTTNIKNELILNGETIHRETFWNQLSLLSTLYSKVQYEVLHIDVCGLTHEILHLHAKLHLQLNRRVIQMLYPTIQDELVNELIGKWISVDLHQVFYFDGHYMTSISTDCDWIQAWRTLSPSYTHAWHITKDAKIDRYLYIHLSDTL